jgi:ABC-type multidrug transport system permease subunit
MMANSAIWLAAFVGSLMLFLASKPALNSKTSLQVAGFRTLFPGVVTLGSSIILALTLCLVTNDFGNFIALWLFIWPVSYAIALLVTGLFSALGFVAILALIPIIFYQPVLSGASFPIAALPAFMKNLTEYMPFSDVVTGLTSILIGGPRGDWEANALIAALLGIALIWITTLGWAKLKAKD